MINASSLIEKAEHAIYLLKTVASALPGPKGAMLTAALAGLETAFNAAGVRKALEEVQAEYSAKAQAIADEWPAEPTKPE